MRISKLTQTNPCECMNLFNDHTYHNQQYVHGLLYTHACDHDHGHGRDHGYVHVRVRDYDRASESQLVQNFSRPA